MSSEHTQKSSSETPLRSVTLDEAVGLLMGYDIDPKDRKPEEYEIDVIHHLLSISREETYYELQEARLELERAPSTDNQLSEKLQSTIERLQKELKSWTDKESNYDTLYKMLQEDIEKGKSGENSVIIVDNLMTEETDVVHITKSSLDNWQKKTQIDTPNTGQHITDNVKPRDELHHTLTTVYLMAQALSHTIKYPDKNILRLGTDSTKSDQYLDANAITNHLLDKKYLHVDEDKYNFSEPDVYLALYILSHAFAALQDQSLKNSSADDPISRMLKNNDQIKSASISSFLLAHSSSIYGQKDRKIKGRLSKAIETHKNRAHKTIPAGVFKHIIEFAKKQFT